MPRRGMGVEMRRSTGSGKSGTVMPRRGMGVEIGVSGARWKRRGNVMPRRGMGVEIKPRL